MPGVSGALLRELDAWFDVGRRAERAAADTVCELSRRARSRLVAYLEGRLRA